MCKLYGVCISIVSAGMGAVAIKPRKMDPGSYPMVMRSSTRVEERRGEEERNKPLRTQRWTIYVVIFMKQREFWDGEL